MSFRGSAQGPLENTPPTAPQHSGSPGLVPLPYLHQLLLSLVDIKPCRIEAQPHPRPSIPLELGCPHISGFTEKDVLPHYQFQEVVPCRQTDGARPLINGCHRRGGGRSRLCTGRHVHCFCRYCCCFVLGCGDRVSPPSPDVIL